MDYLYPDYRYKTAATVFLGSGIRNVTFDNVMFLNHVASYSSIFLQTFKESEMTTKYFPANFLNN